jgi:vacuolar protein sorting-associated protein VTA1
MDHQPQQPPFNPQPAAPTWSAPVVEHAPSPIPQQQPPPASYSVTSHKNLDKAQKHAKFAISALNFDDVPTAVQELRNALASLGAQ